MNTDIRTYLIQEIEEREQNLAKLKAALAVLDGTSPINKPMQQIVQPKGKKFKKHYARLTMSGIRQYFQGEANLSKSICGLLFRDGGDKWVDALVSRLLEWQLKSNLQPNWNIDNRTIASCLYRLEQMGIVESFQVSTIPTTRWALTSKAERVAKEFDVRPEFLFSFHPITTNIVPMATAK